VWRANSGVEPELAFVTVSQAGLITFQIQKPLPGYILMGKSHLQKFAKTAPNIKKRYIFNRKPTP
jgi:hypothetical protein